MSVDKIIFTSDYGERIISRRRFIKDVDGESIEILAELLKISLTRLKSDISLLASASLTYKAYRYKDGYLLEEVLRQPQTSQLKYAFKNPYTAALKVMDDIFHPSFISDEKSLSIAKERALYKYQELKADTNRIADSLLNIDFSDIFISPKALISKKIEEILKAKEKVLKSQIGEKIYIGRESKNPMILKDEIKEDLFSLSDKDISMDGSFSSKKFDGDMKVYLLKNDEVKDINDYLSLVQCCYALSSQLKKKANAFYGSKVDISFKQVDKEHTLLKVKVDRYKLDQIEDRFDSLLKEKIKIDSKDYSNCLIKATEDIMSLKQNGLKLYDSLFRSALNTDEIKLDLLKDKVEDEEVIQEKINRLQVIKSCSLKTI